MIKTLYSKLYKNKDADNKELIVGGASAFSVRAIGMGVNYIFTLLVSRFYGAGGMGILSIYQTILQIFSTIGKFGYNTLMLRYVAFFSAKNKWDSIKDLYYKSLKLTAFSGIVFSAILYFSADLIAQKVYLKPELAFYFRFGAFILLPWVMMELHTDCIRGLKLIFASSFIKQIVLFIVAIVIVAISAFFIHNKSVPVIAYSIGMICAALVSIYWWLKKSKFPEKIIEHVNFTNLSGVAFVFFLTAMFNLLKGWGETTIIARYASISDLGIYKVAFKIATITSVTLNVMIVSLQPKIAELHGKNDFKKLGDIVQNTTAIIFWTSTPILLLFMLFPSFFMGIFGTEFNQALGNKILIILTIGQFINASTGPVSNVLMLAGKQGANTIIVLLSTLICIGLDLLFIPRYGMIGAAWVNVIGFVLFNVVPLLFVRYYFGFYSFNFKKIFLFRGLFHK